MKGKKDDKYFDWFDKMAEQCRLASLLLYDTLKKFEPNMLHSKMAQMHNIEHEADNERHALLRALARDFITPIDREDIIALADAIDNVTDSIEDVLMRIYMFNRITIRENALKMASIIVDCCEVLKKALFEFRNFKKSNKLHDFIVKVNNLEEQGDGLYTEAVRELYISGADYLEITSWGHIFNYLEKCCDTCEDVTEIMESIILKNS